MASYNIEIHVALTFRKVQSSVSDESFSMTDIV